MKARILLMTLMITQSQIAESTCVEYIPNDWPDSRYTVETISDDNVVTDNRTGLMWKQCIDGLSGADCSTGFTIGHTWQQALSLAHTSEYAGYTSWRVPNIKELGTIVAKNCSYPSINETIFPNTPFSSFIWSSSPVVFGSTSWVVYFSVGQDTDRFRDDFYHVRLVREVWK